MRCVKCLCLSLSMDELRNACVALMRNGVFRVLGVWTCKTTCFPSRIRGRANRCTLPTTYIEPEGSFSETRPLHVPCGCLYLSGKWREKAIRIASQSKDLKHIVILAQGAKQRFDMYVFVCLSSTNALDIHGHLQLHLFSIYNTARHKQYTLAATAL